MKSRQTTTNSLRNSNLYFKQTKIFNAERATEINIEHAERLTQQHRAVHYTSRH